MKTETQIAVENIRFMKFEKNEKIYKIVCFEHKQICQRFLEFSDGFDSQLKEQLSKASEKIVEHLGDDSWLFILNILTLKKGKISFKSKITDLKNAIKSYEAAGI